MLTDGEMGTIITSMHAYLSNVPLNPTRDKLNDKVILVQAQYKKQVLAQFMSKVRDLMNDYRDFDKKPVPKTPVNDIKKSVQSMKNKLSKVTPSRGKR